MVPPINLLNEYVACCHTLSSSIEPLSESIVTLATPSFDAALSYFVGGNDAYEEDKGFAIKPYTNVKFDNVGIINNSCRMAVAMGNYFFTDTKGGETKVEYTFAYVKDSDGDLRIVAHQSSLPYNPNGN